MSYKKAIEMGNKRGVLNYVDNETPRRYFVCQYAEKKDVDIYVEDMLLLIQEMEMENKNDQ